jgi:hypothetical protein
LWYSACLFHNLLIFLIFAAYNQKMKNPAYGKEKSGPVFLFLLSLVLSVLALAFRNPEALTHPQFFAEDGIIFFQANFNWGVKSIFMPYAGYLLTIPRVCTMLIFQTMSFESMPAAYNYTTLLLFLGVASYIWWRTSFNPYIKFFLIMAMSLAPVGSETVLTITNIQWYVSFLIPLIFLTGYNKKYFVVDAIVLFLISLTGPYCVVFFPLIAGIVWYRAQTMGQWKNERWFFFIYLLATVIQILFIVFATDRTANNYSIIDKVAHSPKLLYMHVTSPLGIESIHSGSMNNVLFAVLLIVLAAWIFICWLKLIKGKNAAPFFFMVAALLLAASSVYGIVPTAVQYLNPMSAGSRYFLGPCVFLLWSVLTYNSKPGETFVTAEKINWKKVNWRNVAFGALFTFYTYVLATKIPPLVFVEKNWPEQAKKIKEFKQGHLEVPINPDPWKIYLDK